METGLDIQDPLIVPKDVNPGGGLDQNFRELSAGAGSDLFKVNRDGVFIGATNFADAPWRVTYAGVQRLGANGEIVLDGPNGTITVGSTTVIDENGLNSTQNFQTDGYLNLGPFSVTNTSYATLSGASLAPFTLDRDTRVLLFANFEGTMNNALDFIQDHDFGSFQLYDTNTSTTRLVFNFTGSAATYVDWDNGTGLINSTSHYLRNVSYSKAIMLTFGAGQHTIVAQAKTSGNQANISGLDFGYIILGL